MRRKKRGHGKALSFKYHGVILEYGDERYQVIHETLDTTYAVPIDKKGKVGGLVQRFPRK